ncbi:MAG: helix-turn-helix domain-containing protein [Pseudonocardia sp.]|nr:helix-turn-helix domain-containing protein [Pseudonocardia sp.]
MGARVRQIRRSRRKSLRVVAGLAGISAGHLSRIENGQRALDRRSLIVALANALEIAPSELTALPVPAPVDGDTDAAVGAVRTALIAASRHRFRGEPVPVGVLQARVAQIRETRRLCGFATVGQQLPELIRDIHLAIDTGREVKALVELAVTMHVHVSLMWLRDAGASVDLRWQAAALAQELAERLADPTSLGVAAYGSANALFAAGSFELAEAELDAVTLPPTNAETAGMIGMVTMTRSLIASADQRPGDVRAPMQVARDLAERFGEPEDHDRLGFGFGPTNVGLWEMALALESDDPDRAVSLAHSIQPERHPFTTRQSQYWIDYGRALARVRRRNAAVMALRKAERLFPARVHRSPFAREVIAELVAHAKRDAVGRELRGMAYRVGLPV